MRMPPGNIAGASKPPNYQALTWATQGYSTQSRMLTNLVSFRNNGLDKQRYDIRKSANGEFYPVIKATNGRVISRAAEYSSRSNADRAIQKVISNLAGFEAHLATKTGLGWYVFQASDGGWYNHFKAANGEIVLDAHQRFSSEAAAWANAFSAQHWGRDPANFDTRVSPDQNYYFNIVASNGRNVSGSGLYTTQARRDNAISIVVALLRTVHPLDGYVKQARRGRALLAQRKKRR